MFTPYQYIGETPRRFDCEGDKERSLMPQKTYLLNSEDWHVKAWVRRGLLVDGLAENITEEDGDIEGENNDDTTSNTDMEKGGNGAYDLPDYVDESDEGFFYFGWSKSQPVRMEKQNRETAQSYRAHVPHNLLFQGAWQRRKTLNYE